ncbi:uncharacterized protein [Littorina saxatilis]|uniref:C2H2-type domain-containing protein n=1 Tax=Littorina saxatilis TaxID=31220 RepID=A0AAN9G1M5_9CAEN
MEDGASIDRNNFTPVKLPPSSSSTTATPSSNGPRPHRCEICQRSFREVATLRKHEQLHRADRPYVCTTCGKSFLWSSNLKVHERVHTGERPYKCKICHRCFTQSNDLRRHERNVHMRGKLYGYKHAGAVGMGRGAVAAGPGAGGSQVNIATYQAFAMQQRALLQQALTYESYLHNAAAVTQAQMFPQPPAHMMANKADGMHMAMPGGGGMVHRGEEQGRRDVQRSPIKLEQVTPPQTPGEGEGVGEKRGVVSSHGHDSLQHSPVSPRYMPSSTCHAPPMPPLTAPHRSPPMLMSVGHGPYNAKDASPLHQSPHQLSPPTARNSTLPSFSSFRHPPHSSTEYDPDQRHALTPSSLPGTMGRGRESELGEVREREGDKYPPCDSVMDLSMSKTPDPRPSSAPEKVMSPGERGGEEHAMPPPKTPSSESECDGKRDVTTTSSTPVADNGIHHCRHCNIFFYDYTMFHLHSSLHSPYPADYPFRCPSCGKHCQDRIEFMFHTVWHVKYPHTIPEYQPFKETMFS